MAAIARRLTASSSGPTSRTKSTGIAPASATSGKVRTPAKICRAFRTSARSRSSPIRMPIRIATRRRSSTTAADSFIAPP